MNTEFNWLVIIIATVVGMGVAGIWYTKLFGNAWTKITGITKGGKTAFALLWISNFATATGLNFLINNGKAYYKGDFIYFALFTGFVVWLAFSATTLIQHNAFEHKPAKLTLINIAYQLVLYTTMALVIGLFLK